MVWFVKNNDAKIAIFEHLLQRSGGGECIRIFAVSIFSCGRCRLDSAVVLCACVSVGMPDRADVVAMANVTRFPGPEIRGAVAGEHGLRVLDHQPAEPSHRFGKKIRVALKEAQMTAVACDHAKSLFVSTCEHCR